jgi:hypothetical protein
VAVTVSPPDDDLAVLAGIQGVLIEVLEARNGELEARVTELEERLARLERLLSRNSGNDLPRDFRTAYLWLIHAADCRSRYSSWTCCGVRY